MFLDLLQKVGSAIISDEENTSMMYSNQEFIEGMTAEFILKRFCSFGNPRIRKTAGPLYGDHEKKHFQLRRYA